MSSNPSFPQQGDVLRGYRIARLLQRKGPHFSLLAHHAEQSFPVLIRGYQLPSPPSRQVFAHIQKQAHLLYQRKHPSLLRPYRVDWTNATGLFWVMEWFGGVPLDQWVQQQARPTLPHIISIVRQLTDGVHELHAQGLYHGVLSPSSILLAQENNQYILKIADVGLSHCRQQLIATQYHPEFSFISPEQIHNAEHAGSKEGDVFAVAATLFYVLTGMSPFGPLHNFEALKQNRKNHRTFKLHQLLPSSELPESIDRVLACALHPDPKQRYPEVRILRQALEQSLHIPHHHEQATPMPPTPKGTPAFLSAFSPQHTPGQDTPHSYFDSRDELASSSDVDKTAVELKKISKPTTHTPASVASYSLEDEDDDATMLAPVNALLAPPPQHHVDRHGSTSGITPPARRSLPVVDQQTKDDDHGFFDGSFAEGEDATAFFTGLNFKHPPKPSKDDSSPELDQLLQQLTTIAIDEEDE
ncbi:MAG: hypothetical protein CL920_22915 [Deltaproteobacteria bacterium]|nr:hypothetical protein [Deltaproteobacteria bacterium]|tara:strand:- start:13438 stop:14850 length:1413 start_codon:yes stop_codon:yes gene_type:complete